MNYILQKTKENKETRSKKGDQILMSEKKITNIIDYLTWRGDLSFEADHFNEIDALILARFSYMDLKDIVYNDQNAITIAKAYEKYSADLEKRPKFAKEDPELFRLMAESIRFKDLVLIFHEFIFSDEEVEQFSSVTIELPGNRHYLSFRGTDDTINGWKEDLLMTFEKTIPSQIDALEYTHLVAKHTSGDLFLGGHSKGGNLAVYAALFSLDEVAARIKGVFSFDGPGLHEDLVKDIDDKIALPVIATYMPQSSFFGKMLSHRESQVIVNSAASGVMQHDIYSWEVIRKDFVLTSEDTLVSRVFDQAFHDYLAKLSSIERKEVVNIIFDAIEECDVDTMEDLTKHFVFNIIKVMKHVNQLDEKDAKLVKEAIGILGDSIKGGLIDEFSSKIPFLKKGEKEEKKQ